MLQMCCYRVSLKYANRATRGGVVTSKAGRFTPTVTLVQTYGAIAYYLENKKLIDEFIAEVDREFFRGVRPLSETNPELAARLDAARNWGSKRA